MGSTLIWYRRLTGPARQLAGLRLESTSVRGLLRGDRTRGRDREGDPENAGARDEGAFGARSRSLKVRGSKPAESG